MDALFVIISLASIGLSAFITTEMARKKLAGKVKPLEHDRRAAYEAGLIGWTGIAASLVGGVSAVAFGGVVFSIFFGGFHPAAIGYLVGLLVVQRIAWGINVRHKMLLGETA